MVELLIRKIDNGWTLTKGIEELPLITSYFQTEIEAFAALQVVSEDLINMIIKRTQNESGSQNTSETA